PPSSTPFPYTTLFRSEWPSPGGPKSQPYGMYAVHDVLWYSEAGVQPNTLVRFDPKTEQFQTWTIPSGGGVVRNMDATRDGSLALDRKSTRLNSSHVSI